MKSDQSKIIKAFSALGDKTRFQLLTLLRKNPDYCVSELAGQVGISNAGVSQQLKILEQAGLVVRERRGQRICYQIADENLTRHILAIIE